MSLLQAGEREREGGIDWSPEPAADVWWLHTVRSFVIGHGEVVKGMKLDRWKMESNGTEQPL